MPEAAFIELLRSAGFDTEVLHRGRNARTGHAASVVVIVRGTKRNALAR